MNSGSSALTIVVRPSKAGDIAAIAKIYGFHVLNGLASFEVMAPSVDEMAKRRADVVGRNFPYLVAEAEGRVVGFAYASLYHGRPAYRHTFEDSVYVHKEYTGRHVGVLLLEALIEACEKAGCRQLIAIIGDSGNEASIRLHAACGFAHTGTLEAVGFKFGRWVDSVIMQRQIGSGASNPPGEQSGSAR